MSEGSTAQQIFDVFPSVEKLARLMQADSKAIERDILKRGDDLLVFYQDSNFRNSFQNLREIKIKCIAKACRDIAEGGELMKSSLFGVTFREGRMTQFVSPYGSRPSGTVVFSISWKKSLAFQSWRDGQAEMTTQQEVNDGLYRLAVMLAENLIPEQI